MKKTFTILFLAFFLLYPFLGCDSEINGATDEHTTIKVVQVVPKDLQKPVGVNQAARSVARGANDFAFRLSAALAEQNGTTRNMVCSPLSVWIPLTALVNAVNVQYKTDLLTALGVPDIEDAAINTGVSRMLYDLTRQRDKERFEPGTYRDPVKIANAVFVDRNITIEDDFAQAFMDYYRGSSINVDFKSPAAVAEVNDWVDKNTNGMIQDIIRGFDPGTLAVLANAIYFFDQWDWKFDPNKTKPDIFYAPQGETTASYMLREGDGVYFEDERLQALPLSFTAGGGLYILLPKDGDAAGLLASMTNDYFLAIQEGSTLAEGKLLLPRFSINGNVISLKDTLTAMGVPLFADNSLTGLIKETAIQLSNAIHKAVIEVDEKGTTAAAVTILPYATSPGPMEEPPRVPFEMICDKPFVFILYDRTTDGGKQVLFTGMVNRP